MLGQDPQDLEFEPGEVDRIARDTGGVRRRIELQVADPDDVWPAVVDRAPARSGGGRRRSGPGARPSRTAWPGSRRRRPRAPGPCRPRGRAPTGPGSASSLRHARVPTITRPSRSGRPRSSRIRSGFAAANSAERRFGVGRLGHPIVVLLEQGGDLAGASPRRPRRAGSRSRARSDQVAARSSRSIARPPSSDGRALIRPPIVSTRPRTTARPRPSSAPGTLATPGHPVELLEQVRQVRRPARPDRRPRSSARSGRRRGHGPRCARRRPVRHSERCSRAGSSGPGR